MKWIIRLLLFIGILLTAGTSKQLKSISKHQTGNGAVLSEEQHFLTQAQYTPVLPVRDSRVFQIVEDEDNITSRTKKISQYAISLFIVLSSALTFFQTRVKIRIDGSYPALNSYPRYIRLRTIRI